MREPVPFCNRCTWTGDSTFAQQRCIQAMTCDLANYRYCQSPACASSPFGLASYLTRGRNLNHRDFRRFRV